MTVDVEMEHLFRNPVDGPRTQAFSGTCSLLTVGSVGIRVDPSKEHKRWHGEDVSARHDPQGLGRSEHRGNSCISRFDGHSIGKH